jgi:hypothetical protein
MPDAPLHFSQASTAFEFFTAYVRMLVAQCILYLVLHGYEQYPTSLIW